MKYTVSSAVVSSCEVYRYTLRRAWAGDGDGEVVWIMLNPSTADGSKDDPTIRRCVAFAESWGKIGIIVVNLFARRASKPAVCFDGLHDPIGPVNNAAIEAATSGGRLVVAAWGSALAGKACPVIANRAWQVRRWLHEANVALHHLGTTIGGHPKHPLARGVHRIPDDQQPIPWPMPTSKVETAR